MNEPVECCTCYRTRPLTEMTPARNLLWEVIPGWHYCRDSDDCYHAARQIHYLDHPRLRADYVARHPRDDAKCIWSDA